MAGFPETPATLLARMAVEATQGTDERQWTLFFELYEPALRKFAEMQGAKNDAEDIAQEILLKLVEVLREGRYRASEGRFRAYLATLVRREIVSRWRKGQARAADAQVSIDATDAGVELIRETNAGDLLDAQWRLARRYAAIEHALTKTALSQQSRDIYRAYAIEERPIADVARRFGVSRNVVAQVKTRVDRMVAALEGGM